MQSSVQTTGADTERELYDIAKKFKELTKKK